MKFVVQLLMLNWVLMGVAYADITIYAAVSLTNAINDINNAYQVHSKTRIKTSYASSGVLARQIERGSPADVFVSADVAWAMHLDKKGKVLKGSYKHLLGNRLVLITPKSSPIKSVTMDKSTDFGKLLTGKICTGNLKSVPVGRYAKEALTYMGWITAVNQKLVETEDARQALNFVNRGECQFGIVYETDAKMAKNVKIVGTFPLASHTAIVYPIVMIKDNAETRQYYNFLQSSKAKQIYQKYGFSIL